MRKVFSIFFILSLTAFLRAEILENYSNRNVSEFYKDKNYDLVLLNYWATYCLPCKKEMPDFDKLYKKYKDKNVLVLGASIDSKEKVSFIKKLLKKLKVEYPILYDVDSKFEGIDVSGLPKTFVLNKDGNILKEIDGKRNFEYFDQLIVEYLNSEVNSIEKKEINRVESDYYYFKISKVEDKKEIQVLIKTIEGIHLNGEGYPKLVVELENQNIFEQDKISFEVEGIGEGVEKSWTLAVSDYKVGDIIKVRVKAIACTDNSCRQLKDEFNWILETE